MKAIIMAAGIGSRLKKQLGNQPKCCTPVGEEILVERMLRLLAGRVGSPRAFFAGEHRSVVRDDYPATLVWHSAMAEAAA